MPQILRVSPSRAALIALAQAVVALVLQLLIALAVAMIGGAGSGAAQIVGSFWLALGAIPGVIWVVAVIVLALIRRRIAEIGALTLVAGIVAVVTTAGFWGYLFASRGGVAPGGWDVLFLEVAALFGIVLVISALLVGLATLLIRRGARRSEPSLP